MVTPNLSLILNALGPGPDGFLIFDGISLDNLPLDRLSLATNGESHVFIGEGQADIFVRPVVPEPATLVLFGLGAATFLPLRSRLRSKARGPGLRFFAVISPPDRQPRTSYTSGGLT